METKENILANLYAIRGGLSLISQNTDEIRQWERKKRSLETCSNAEVLLSARDDYQKARTDYEATCKEYEKLKKEYETFLKTVPMEKGKTDLDLQKKPEEVRLEAHEYAKKQVSSPFVNNNFFLWILRVIIFPITLVQYFSYKKRKQKAFTSYIDEWYEWQKRESNLQSRFKTPIKQKEMKLEIAENRLRFTEEKYQKEKTIQDVEKGNNAGAIKQCEEQITSILTESKMIKFVMNENFDSVLHESDWGSIDLLIYYIETGRADSVKEALQLLDRQKQTNQIINAISEAKKSLVTTINTAMNRMSEALARSFSIISNQLSQIAQNQREEISALHANMLATASLTQAIQASAEMKGKAISAQTEAIRLNNALIAKANKQSEQLLFDLRCQSMWDK